MLLCCGVWFWGFWGAPGAHWPENDARGRAVQADYEAMGKDIWGGAKILLLPTVTINTNQYRGRLDTPSVVRALCAGFSESTEPEVSRVSSRRRCINVFAGGWSA